MNFEFRETLRGERENLRKTSRKKKNKIVLDRARRARALRAEFLFFSDTGISYRDKDFYRESLERNLVLRHRPFARDNRRSFAIAHYREVGRNRPGRGGWADGFRNGTSILSGRGVRDGRARVA